MFIRKFKGGKDNQHSYYKLIETYRDSSGKVKHRTIKSLGREDMLLAKDPLAIQKLYERYGGSRQEKDNKAAMSRAETTLAEMAEMAPEGAEYPIVNYGHYVVRHLWRAVFEFPRKFDQVQKVLQIHYNIDDAVSFMVATKILHPDSVLGTYDSQDQYLGNPIEAVPLDSLYDMFSVVKAHKDSLMAWANRALAKEVPADRNTLFFYDVTNTYFESSMSDEEKAYPDTDFAENVLAMADQPGIKERLSQDCFDATGSLVVEKLPEWFWEAVSEENIEFLRMRGPSKEHRTDLPLISIALVIDKYGFPMDFAVYSGNRSEFKSMKQSIEKFKVKYGIDQAILVADRGLNSSSNLRMLQDNGLGYVMAQKISPLSAELKKELTDIDSYVPFDPDHPDKGFYKVIDGYRPKTVENAIESTLIFTFNSKRYRRDLAILEAWRNIVLDKAAKKTKLGKRNSGWQSLAKLEGDSKNKLIVGVDEQAYAKKKALCGFAAMIYKSPPKEKPNNSNLNDQSGATHMDMGMGRIEGKEKVDICRKAKKQPDASHIASIYHQLNQIEDCFRVMKTNLGLRPIYLWNTDHIKGHVAICVLALILVRYIQWKLQRANESLSIHEICSALNGADLVCWRGKDGKLYVHKTIRGIKHLRDGRQRLSVKELVRKVIDSKSKERPIDKIMKVCGLVPLNSTYSRHELSRCLKTRFRSDEDMLSAPLVALLYTNKAADDNKNVTTLK